MLAGGQHGNHHLGALHCVLGAAGGLATFGLDSGQRIGAEVKGLDAVAGLDKVDGHGGAHIAQADESDLHVCLLCLLLNM